MKRLHLLLLLVGSSTLFAASFWESKAPEDWSREEIEQILTDSPWAHEASVRFVGDRGAPIGGAGSGPSVDGTRSRFPGAGPVDGGLPDGGWGRRLVATDTKRNALGEADTVIRWSSALPIRQALGAIGTPYLEQRRELLKRYYVISFSSIPSGMAALADDPEQLRAAARLTPKGQTPIRAERAEIRPQPATPGVDLYFPRESLGERQVTVDLVGQDYEVTAKFKPRNMVYRGEPAF